MRFRKIYKLLELPLTLCCAGALLLFWNGFALRSPGHDGTQKQKEKMTSAAAQHREVVFLLIMCDVSRINSQRSRQGRVGPKVAADISRQMEQLGVMIKSAVALTQKQLRFVVVADSRKLYEQVAEIIDDWPLQYQSKITFEYLPVWYPPDRKEMMSMFRVCATERLFVPDMLPHEDALIYIDTDLIFMRPPEDLWAEFDNFDSEQVAAMAPCLYHYGANRNSKVPFYGSTGLNAGIMHMNLTRLKNFPGGGWVEANMAVFEEFKEDIVLADQDILNILFNQHPDLMYDLGCEWNYRMFQCWQKKNICPVTSREGAAIIHGNALTFVSGEESKIQAVYESWQDHQLGTPLEDLYETIRERLRTVTAENLPSKCSQLKEIDVVLSQQLINYIDRTRHL